MLTLAPVLAAALAYGAPRATPLALGQLERRAEAPRPDLALHVGAVPPRGGARAAAGDLARRPSAAEGPVCSGEVCQPIVSVPGYEPRYGRAHRSEAFVALLTRAHVEPLATMAWALVATGLRFDYTPVVLDGPNSGGHGWGSVYLRLRLRLDALNRPSIPPRPR